MNYILALIACAFGNLVGLFVSDTLTLTDVLGRLFWQALAVSMVAYMDMA